MHTPPQHTSITLGDPDTFWALIHQAKATCAHNMKAMETFIRVQLVTMGPESAWNFHHILHAYSSLAYQYGLWDAAGIIKEYGCSDDGFIDFRAWLIAQGKEVYLAALRDPDTLAEIEPYGDCCFECLSYVGSDAYEQLTGQSAYMDEMPLAERQELLRHLRAEIVYKDGIQFPREPKDLPDFLPKLCAKYGGFERFQTAQCTWNLDQSVVRRMLQAGKAYDKQGAKKEKSHRKGGTPR